MLDEQRMERLSPEAWALLAHFRENSELPSTSNPAETSKLWQQIYDLRMAGLLEKSLGEERFSWTKAVTHDLADRAGAASPELYTSWSDSRPDASSRGRKLLAGLVLSIGGVFALAAMWPAESEAPAPATAASDVQGRTSNARPLSSAPRSTQSVPKRSSASTSTPDSSAEIGELAFTYTVRDDGGTFAEGMSNDELVQVGRAVCASIDGGKTPEQFANDAATSGVPVGFMGAVIGAATATLCPEHTDFLG